MISKKNTSAAICIALAISVGSLQAAVSEEEAAKLGKELTPVGAEKAGNSAGTIPEWSGGLTKPPAGYKDGGFLVDPFADEKPLFTIKAANMAQYKDNLSPGQIAMLEKYPDYKMPVYPTHRTAAYPQSVYDAIKANATTSELTKDGNGVANTNLLGSSFPIPKNGIEALFNHITRYRGGQFERQIVQVPVQANGSYTLVRFLDNWTFPYTFEGGVDPVKDDNIIFLFTQQVLSPPRQTGDILLVHETLDQVKGPRKAWKYNAGQRRVRRAPNVAYDAPGSSANGQRTTDNFDMFNGAPDRYEWKLVGKKELYIPYNAYKLHSPQLSYKEIHQPGHINQDLTRYELHRVWVVEATLKDDARHIYAKRVLYIDEDTWGLAVVDHYDGRDNLWRVAEGHAIQYYNSLAPFYTAEVLTDVQSGRYLTLGLTNEEPSPFNYNYKGKRSDYKPGNLRRIGKR